MNDHQGAWERSPGYIYFIGADDPPAAVKIGIARQIDVRKRLAVHQGSNHLPLRLLGVISVEEGDRPMKAAETREAELHNRFQEIRIYKKYTPGGEWFKATPELIDFIGRHTTPPEALVLPVSVCEASPSFSAACQAPEASSEELEMNMDAPVQAANGKRDWTPEEIEATVRKSGSPTAIELLEFANSHSDGDAYSEERKAKFANFGFYLAGCSADGEEKRLAVWSYCPAYAPVIMYLGHIEQNCTPEVSAEFQTRLRRLFGDSIVRPTEWSVPLEDVGHEMPAFKELILWLKQSMSIG